MPRRSIAGTSSTSMVTPGMPLNASRVRRTNSSGYTALAGSVTRSRANLTPWATGAQSRWNASAAAAPSRVRTTSVPSPARGPVSSSRRER